MTNITARFDRISRHRNRRFSQTAVLLVLTIALVACGGSSTATSIEQTGGDPTTPTAGGPADTATVSIDNFLFTPSDLTVAVGATVTWRNVQSVDHTVTGDAAEFDSAQLPQDAEFSQTFDAAGTFSYHCEIHPNMTGTVTVTE